MRILKLISLSILTIQVISCNDLNSKNDFASQEINNLNESLKQLEHKNLALQKDFDSLKMEYSKLKKENHIYNEDFLNFIIKFSEDEEFQKERIDFPIRIEESFIDSNDTIYTRTPENWDFKKYKFHPEGFNIYDNKETKLRESNYRVLRWYAIESEGDLRFYFNGKNGKWYLYKISQSG